MSLKRVLFIIAFLLSACNVLQAEKGLTQTPSLGIDQIKTENTPTTTEAQNTTATAQPTETQFPDIDLDQFFFPYNVSEVVELWEDLDVPQKDRYFTYHLVNRTNREIPYEDPCGYHPGDLIIPLGSTNAYDDFNINVMMPYSGILKRKWTTEGGDDGFTFFLGRSGGEEVFLNIYHTTVSSLSPNQKLEQGDVFGSLTYTINYGGWNETKVHLTLFNPAEDGGTDFLGSDVHIIDITSIALPITMQAMYRNNLGLLLTYQGDNWCDMNSTEKINILLEKYLPDASFCVEGNVVTYCGAREDLSDLTFTQYKYDERSIMLSPMIASTTGAFYDYRYISMPLDPNNIAAIVDNYGCPTAGTDYTHDGLDIQVLRDVKVPVYAVGDGEIIQSNLVNETIGYEVYLLLGQDELGNNTYANYVHLDEAIPVGSRVKDGDIIGYIYTAKGYDHVLYFGIRVGDTPRYETPNDGARGDEADITEILINGLTGVAVATDPQCER